MIKLENESLSSYKFIKFIKSYLTSYITSKFIIFNFMNFLLIYTQK